MLYVDVETYSPTPIKNGVYAYLETVELLTLQVALDDHPVTVIDVANGDLIPQWVGGAFKNPKMTLCSHTSFDRVVLEKLYAWARVGAERWWDTAAQARAHGLPGKLSTLCSIFKLPPELTKLDGTDHIQLFCKPMPMNAKLARATKATHPKEWAEFIQYAGRDVEAMRALRKRMPTWNYRPGCGLESYHLDQKINDRGVAIDMPLVTAAVASVKRLRTELDSQVTDLTDGEVSSANQRDKLLAHLLAEHGVTLPDMTKTTLERRLEDEELPAVVRELIRIRLATATASAAKYAALTRCVSKDGRLRGALLWRGATRTGRWAGRLFQVQNLARVPKHIHPVYDLAAEAIKAGGVELLFADPMTVLGSLVRACISVPLGKKLVVSDLANVEGRVLAWLAGEEWRLKAFADLDAGVGTDLYVLEYVKTFGKTVAEVHADTKAGGTWRLLGKILSLALQYGGGPGAFDSMARNFGVEIPLAEQVASVKSWRKANPQVVKFWYDCERAAKAATLQPGKIFKAGKHIHYERRGGWLLARLPSGRFLCYASPKINEEGRLSFMGPNSYTRKYERLETFGSRLAENNTQAIAMDVVEAALPRAEAAGYPVVITVHDELVCECADTDEFTAEGLSSILAADLPWSAGLPLAAKGFECHSYRKD